ncbi:class I SAM-dependent methyltransferase [Natronobiforma cellulositropha]|uniref:class I SAM-dependent methyltransferase n=1 Tax=Natronobiforma cellulositropha TaxID=1679076 RepID=UPI0021D5A147|nr:class I SAM-dependent methyltransferase [Natronobiforma cellulositropha]
MTTDEPTNAWDADGYQDGHAFVFEYGSGVLELLEVDPGARVLDLGCGTGELTAAIADREVCVVGMDQSEAMLETARETYPKLQFVHGDARELGVDEPFDAVFSNAMLHWVPRADQGRLAASVRAALADDGQFVAEFGGAGNVGGIVGALRAEGTERGVEVDNPWYFPTIGEHTSLLETHGFEVVYATLFDRPTPLEGGADGLRNWLEMFGDSLLEAFPADEREEVYAGVEERLRDTHYEDGTWTADYRRLRFVANAV